MGEKMNAKLSLPEPSKKMFIGRDATLEEFWNIYHAVKKDSYKVINYFGMTGIGKSRLLNAIQEEMDAQKAYYVKIDMDFCLKKEMDTDSVSQSREMILSNLRNQLIDKYKFKFHNFDQLLYKYYEKIGISKEKPEFQMLLSRNENVSNLMDIAKDLIMPLGIPISLVQLLDLGITNLVRAKKKNIKLDMNSYEQLYEYLPYAFAFDLNQNMEKRNAPLVILIDTYEMFVKESFGKGNQKANDKWLRNEDGLIPNTKNVLWVIAGREEVKWEEIKNQKMEVTKHKLEPLTEKDAIQLLKASAIEEPELEKQIWKKCEGVPKYLMLCIEQYLAMQQKGEVPDVSMFEQNLDRITDNVIRYMDINDQEILCYLSCFQNWTDEFIRKRGSQFITCFSYIRYHNLKEKSFVEKNDNGYYAITKLAKESIQKMCAEEIKEIVKENMTEYYREQLNSAITVNQKIEMLMEYVRMNIEENPSEELALFHYQQIKEHVTQLENMHKFIDVAKILRMVYARFQNQNEITKKYILSLVKSDEYEEATQVIHSYMEKNKDNPEIQVESKAMLGELFLYMGKYQEAVQLLEQAYTEKREVFQEDDVELSEKLANSYTRIGKYQKALEIYQKIIEEGKSSNERLTRRNMANAYSQLGKYQEAINIYDGLIKSAEPDSFEMVTLNNNKAMAIARQGDNEQAYEILQDVYQKRKEFLGENYPETINTLYNMATVLSHLNRFEEAIQRFEEVYAKRSEKLGKGHPLTIAAKNGEGMAYFYQGDCKTALKLIQEAYEERCNQLGMEHRDTILTLRNLGLIYQKMNATEKAKETLQEALTRAESTLGKEHPITEEIRKELI